MGAQIEWGDDYVIARRGELNAVDLDFNHIPDAAMTIATTALFAKGTTAIRNVYNWRVKRRIAWQQWPPNCVKWARQSKRGRFHCDYASN